MRSHKAKTNNRSFYNMVDESLVKEISDGARQLKTVTITYRDSKGDISTRETEPYEIRGDIYFGYCIDKQGIRNFQLNNIISAKVTNNTYRPRWEVKI